MKKTMLGLLSTAAFLAASASFPQTNDHIFRSFDWVEDVGSPRAAGMGGAFVGLADDLTAMQFNPAGLGTLHKTEVSAAVLDRTSGTLAFGDTTSSGAGVGFLGAATPIGGTHFVVGAYVAQPFAESIVLNPVSVAGFRDQGSLDTSITDYGAAIAWSPSQKVHVGLRLNISHLSLASGLVHPIRGGIDTLTISMAAGASDLAGSLGVLFRATPELSLGAAYEQGARWSVARSEFAANVGQLPSSPYQFSSPSRLSGGFSYKLTRHTMLVGEADEIFLDRLQQSLSIVAVAVPPAEYRLDSGLEARAGLEVVFPQRGYSLEFRGGVDSQPPGAFQFIGSDPTSESLTFLGASRTTVGTLGASITDKPERFRFDLAGAFGGIRSVVTAGVTTRF
jgi:hypothetical protein